MTNKGNLEHKFKLKFLDQFVSLVLNLFKNSSPEINLLVFAGCLILFTLFLVITLIPSEQRLWSFLITAVLLFVYLLCLINYLVHVSRKGEKKRSQIDNAKLHGNTKFWDNLSSNIFIIIGLEDSIKTNQKAHPKISPRDLEAIVSVSMYLARCYPEKRVTIVPAWPRGWQKWIPQEADIVLIGGFVPNIEFLQYKSLFPGIMRLKMGRLCNIREKQVFHVRFNSLCEDKIPPRDKPEAVDSFSSKHVSRDYGLIFRTYGEIYGSPRRIIGIAGIKGNGTQAAARYITQRTLYQKSVDTVLEKPLSDRDTMELAITAEVRDDSINRIDLIIASFNGRNIFNTGFNLSESCEFMDLDCKGCSFGEDN